MPGVRPHYCGRHAVLVRRRPASCNAVYVAQVVVRIPYVVEQDEDGVWCASAVLRPGVGAFGDGATPEEAITDLRAALETLLEVVGPRLQVGGKREATH